MWQYTNKGFVDGIKSDVDLNVAYFGYNGTEKAKDDSGRAEAFADEGALLNWTEVNETVTAKNETNLRNKPSQGVDSTIVYSLKNGETVLRTGVSPDGWSRVIYNGKTCYAVSKADVHRTSCAPSIARIKSIDSYRCLFNCWHSGLI